MSHASRVLRPLELHIPLKAGTKFKATVDTDADGGEGMILVEMDRVWDFSVRITIEDYGTLGNLIETLQEAQQAELGRIKNNSKPSAYRPGGTPLVDIHRPRRRRKRAK